MYTLEINQPVGWIAVCTFEDHLLEIGAAFCRRYALSEKAPTRLVEDEVIVYEAFYDRRLDPDARDWPEAVEPYDEFDLDWQKHGF